MLSLSHCLSWCFSAASVCLLSGHAVAAVHDGRGLATGLDDWTPAATARGQATPDSASRPNSPSGKLVGSTRTQNVPGTASPLATASDQAKSFAAGTPAAAGPPRIPGQNPNGLQVYLRAGLKTHGPGLHDYPQFLADWSKLLTEHGAVVTGSLHAPLAQELSNVAVLVIYKGDAGFMSYSDRAALEAFIRRGGGIVSIHDALCGPDPVYFATLVGGGKKHGDVNYTLEANVPYTVVDSSSPLMQGIAGLTLRDEAFFNMTWAAKPKIHVLASTVIDGTPSAGTHKGEVVPQIWTYEHALAGGQPARAFVWMQGHKYANFAEPAVQTLLFRAIAWAGRHPVDELVDYRPPPPPAAATARPRSPPLTRQGVSTAPPPAQAVQPPLPAQALPAARRLPATPGPPPAEQPTSSQS